MVEGVVGFLSSDFFRLLSCHTVMNNDLTQETLTDAIHITLAQTQATIATKFVSKEANVAIAATYRSIAPQERLMGLDFPETPKVGEGFEVMIMELMVSERLGIGLYESLTLGLIGVEQNHIIAIADEEALGIIGGNNGLINIVEHDIGNDERQCPTLRHTALALLTDWQLAEFVDPAKAILFLTLTIVDCLLNLVE